MLLLADADSSKPIRGNPWFQKELFLILKNKKELFDEASFESDFFGPYSEIVEEELDDLEQEELIERKGKKIQISNEGKKEILKIERSFDKSFLDLIQEFKELLNDLSEDELLTLVYFNFPETTDESQVKNRIIKDRVKNSISLYKKGRISISKAAEIANMPIQEYCENNID
jgi:uncharacterized protein YwgA